MSRLTYLVRFLLAAGVFLLTTTRATTQDDALDILIETHLTSGLNMGVDSSKRMTNWVTREGDAFKMSYPAGQAWGAVFITVGPPKSPPRPFRDFSAFRTLSLEMKGGSGAKRIDIGIKTNTQPDDGSETKKTVRLFPSWTVYEFSMSDFTDTDASRLYVVTEFVFGGSVAQTVYFRNIKYLKRDPVNADRK